MFEGKLKGNWKKGVNTVKLNVPVMIFNEDSTFIAYIPVLDLSGYGLTEQESVQSLNVVIDEYLTYTLRKNTIVEDLKALGWKVQKKNKPYIAPDLTELINRNEYLHDIFNTKEYSMKRISVNLPQVAS